MITDKSRYEKIQTLLDRAHEFPGQYLHKFIGANSPAFHAAVAEMESVFPTLKLQIRRESEAGKYSAYTFDFHAQSSDEVILLVEVTGNLAGLVAVY